MANEVGGKSSSSLASSPVGRSGDTSSEGLPAPIGSYELQILPDKARNIATSETSSDDDLDSIAGRPENSTRSVKKAMSRVPLLVRSSPAQGTGKLVLRSAVLVVRPRTLGRYTRATIHMVHQFLLTTRANCTQGLMAASLFLDQVLRTLTSMK
jgi:hypothetical protein